MSPALKSLLIDMRQHPAFREMLNMVEKPNLPRYRPAKSDTVETMGAKTIFASGQIEQHDRWLYVLTGETPSQQETT